MNQSQHDSEKFSTTSCFMAFEKRSLTQKNNSKQIGHKKSLLFRRVASNFLGQGSFLVIRALR